LLIATQSQSDDLENLNQEMPYLRGDLNAALNHLSLKQRTKFIEKIQEKISSQTAIQNLNFYAELLDLLKSTQGQVSFMGGEKVEGLGNGKFPHHAAMLLKAIQSGEFANDPERLCSKYAVIFKELKRRPKLLGKRDPKVAETYGNIVDLMVRFKINKEYPELSHVEPSAHPESYFDQYLEIPRAAQLFSKTLGQLPESKCEYKNIQASQQSEQYFRDTYLS